MLERDYQKKLIKKLKLMFPGCIVLKNDANYMQGFPDLILLVDDRWFALEVKTSANARQQPNQSWYVDRLSEMSYAAFVYPENEEDILDEIQQSLRYRG